MSWYNPDWQYSKKITIDYTKIDAILEDFTVAVILADANFDFSKVRSDEYDIRFVATDNTTLLDFERAQTHSSINLSTSLISHFMLNDNAENTTVDDSGTGNHDGTSARNTSLLHTDVAKLTSAFDLNGTTDYIDCTNHADYNFGVSSPFSISAWIKTSDTNGSIVARSDVNQSHKGYNFEIASGKLSFWIHDTHPTATRQVVGVTSLNTDTWYFVNCTYDGSGTVAGMKLYINGEEERATTTTAGTLSNINPNKSLLIGARWNNTAIDSVFDGIIDSVRIYSKVLAPEDIQALYNLGTGSESNSTVNSYAIYYVKIPDISNESDTDFYIYYGHPDASNVASASDAWDGNTDAVWHLHDHIASTDVVDSKGLHIGSAQHGNTSTDSVLGKLGRALNFIGASGDFITAVDHADFDVTNEMTVTMLVFVPTISVSGELITKNPSGVAGNNYPGNYELNFQTTGKLRFMYQTSSGTTFHYHDATNALIKGKWQYIGFSVNPTGNVTKIYTDGLPNGQDTVYATWGQVNNQTLKIGRRTDGGSFTGIIQHVRFSAVARSDAWIKAEYNSFFNTLVSYGIELLNPTSEAIHLTEDYIVGAGYSQVLNETLSLSELIDIYTKVAPLQNIGLSDVVTMYRRFSLDIDNDVRFNGIIRKYLNNKVNTCIRIISDFGQRIRFLVSSMFNLNNDLRTQKLKTNNITNDIRTVLSWQRTPTGSPKSLGKSYIKVYINSVEQTDVDIDSISIGKGYNEAFNASFTLGRPYDINIPLLGSTISIQYNNYNLFTGYITSVTPSDAPDSININCKNEMWKLENTNANFNIGHTPIDSNTGLPEYEYIPRYGTINGALSSGCGFSTSIGNYIPQEMGCSDTLPSVITTLIQNCGNFAWFIDEYGNKRIVTLGGGDAVNLSVQKLNENLNLYHVLSHSFSSIIDNLINQYLVLTGNIVYKSGNRPSISEGRGGVGTGKTYNTENPLIEHPESAWRVCNPDWNSDYERRSDISGTGSYGYDSHLPQDDGKYDKVFKQYTFDPHKYDIYNENEYVPYLLIYLDGNEESNFPSVDTEKQVYEEGGRKYTSGFNLDLVKGTLELNEPHYTVYKDTAGAISGFVRANVRLYFYRKVYSKEYLELFDFSDTPNDVNSTLPDNIEQLTTDFINSYPGAFLTSKVGNYPEIRRKILQLSGYTVQNSYLDWDSSTKTYKYRQGWNDLPFAYQQAMWELSKTSDVKITGTITLTLDAVLYYNLDLTKRIIIPGVINSALNITQLNYNLANFTVDITLESFAPYQLTTSYQKHPSN